MWLGCQGQIFLTSQLLGTARDFDGPRGLTRVRYLMTGHSEVHDQEQAQRVLETPR